MKRFLRRAMSLLLAAAVTVTAVTVLPAWLATPVQAVTQEEINALKNDAKGLAAQQKEIKDQLAAAATEKGEALQQKALLEQEIDLIEQRIDTITEQIAKYDDLIAQKEVEIGLAQEEEQRRYELFCRRVRELEEQGEVTYWSILFDSSDFNDLLDRFIMVEEFMDYDNAVMEQLIAIREQIQQDKADLETARQEQQDAKTEQEQAKAELEDRRAKVDQLIAEISSKEEELAKMEANLQAAANAMDAEIRKKEAELAAQLSKIVSEAGFIWPLKNNKTLTSLFGNRIHPITGKPNNHTGIDIAAPGGTTIMAAKSGLVITSTRNSSYGNYVVVSHGNGQTTLYAHMSKRSVSEGQTVTQGQELGKVGSTGSSSGNHLHFEIRLNGTRQDPLNYFKGSNLYIQSGGKTYPYTVN